MLCATSSGSGRVQSGEADLWLRPSKGFQPGARRGVIFCHEGGATGLAPIDFTSFPGTARVVQGVAANGWPTASQDLGGTSTWANPTSQTRLGQTDVWCYAAGDTPRASASLPRAIVAVSGGAGTAISYYGKSPGHVADVAAFVLIIPLWDLDRMLQGNIGGAAAPIRSAWDLGPSDPLPAGANPKDNTGLLNGKPTLILYSSDDNVCDATQAALMVSAFGANATAVSLGAVGHSDASLNAVDIEGVVLPWLRANAPA